MKVRISYFHYRQFDSALRHARFDVRAYAAKDATADEVLPDARRYFKQSEIVLFRQAPEGLTLAQEQNKMIAAS
jgi:hypothetical protein